MAGGFIFGGDTGVQSAEELARRRKLVDALLDTGDVMPRTFGEGLTVFGRAIAGKLQDKKLSAKEDAERARVADQFNGLTGMSSGGYAPTYGSAPVPPPDPNSPHALGEDAMAALGKPSIATKADPASIKAGLVARGLPDHVAEGFVMNMMDESGLNPGINEVNPTVPGSRGGFGLYQLTGPRRVAYEAFAAERGVPLDDVDAQLDFLMSELQGSESGAASAILATKTPGEAGAAIVSEFLRPAEEHRASRAADYLGGTGSGGMDIAALAEMASNPYLPEGQRAVVSALLTQAMTPPDPMDALALEKAQLEIDAMKNPKADPMAEIELAQAQLDYEQDKNSKPDPGYVMLTPEEAKAAGLPPGAYQKGADGKIVEIGGDEVTVNAGDSGGTFDKESGKAAATRFDAYVQDGWQAQQMTGDLQTLATLAPMISTGVEGKVLQTLGPMAEALGIEIDGLGEGQAFQSIVDRMAPLMRKPGSGASSDFDAKQFLNSLPKIGNTPEGNAIIMETLSAVQTAKMEAGRIAALAQSGEMTWQEAEKMIREMPDPYAKFKAYSSGTSAATGNTTSSGVTWSVAP